MLVLRNAAGPISLAVIALAAIFSANIAHAQYLDESCAYVDDYDDSDESNDIAYDDCGVAPGTTALGGVQQGIADAQQQSQIARALSGQHNGGAFSIFPTGRVMKSKHDGLDQIQSGLKTGEFESNEYSAFINASYDVPGIVFGGQLKLSALVGGLHLRSDQDAGLINLASRSENDSYFVGGGSVWSQGSFYTSSVWIFFFGETDTTFSDGIGTGAVFSDTNGFVSNSTAGYVFDLPGWGENVRFDLRGSIGNAKAEDEFTGTTDPVNLSYDARETELDVWHGTISGMLFQLIQTDGGITRPFVQLSYRHQFEYDLQSVTAITGAANLLITDYDQSPDYGRIDIGFDHVSGPYTFGAALYGEASADESVIGARVGMSYRFASE